ncbi:MAG TPA: isochorismatase family cysteine hydrolase [Acetobacteraceae bacterium]|jgi:nicotinamidase-related amidase|nr:isochorismatase family cysteine hydrolase [Acetobacteraceae bacterium]
MSLRDPGRDRPIVPARSALFIVDVQNGTFNDAEAERHPEFHAAARDIVLPNLVRVVAACRHAGVEVIYTVIENLTRDGRDRGLDYKLSNLGFPPGSWEARVCDAVAPAADEIILPKSSSSAFNSTVLDYVLRNLGVTDLFVAGFLTDQCIDHNVKDAADRGYYAHCLHDACMADTRARHEAALACFRGYCRMLDCAAFLGMLDRPSDARS